MTVSCIADKGVLIEVMMSFIPKNILHSRICTTKCVSSLCFYERKLDQCL